MPATHRRREHTVSVVSVVWWLWSAFVLFAIVALSRPLIARASDWVAVPTDDGDEYYWNQVTGETTWTLPYDSGLSAGAGSWAAEIDPATGDTYYYNIHTGETTWDVPSGYVTPSETTSDSSKLSSQRDDVEKGRVQPQSGVSAATDTPTDQLSNDEVSTDSSTMQAGDVEKGVAEKAAAEKAAAEKAAAEKAAAEKAAAEKAATEQAAAEKAAAEKAAADKAAADKAAADKAAAEKAAAVKEAAEKAAAEKEAAEKALADAEHKRIEKEAAEKAAADIAAAAKVAAEKAAAEKAMAEAEKIAAEKVATQQAVAEKAAAEKAAAEKAAAVKDDGEAKKAAAEKAKAEEAAAKAEKVAAEKAAAARVTDVAVDSNAGGDQRALDSAVSDDSNESAILLEQKRAIAAEKASARVRVAMAAVANDSISAAATNEAQLAVDAIWGVLLDHVLESRELSSSLAHPPHKLQLGVQERLRSLHENVIEVAHSLAEQRPHLKRFMALVLSERQVRDTRSTVHEIGDKTDLQKLETVAKSASSKSHDLRLLNENRGVTETTRDAIINPSPGAQIAIDPSVEKPVVFETPATQLTQQIRDSDSAVRFEFTLSIEKQPVRNLDTNFKEKGDEALLHLIPHSKSLATTLNSERGFKMTFVSTAKKDRRPYSHAPINCGDNPTRDSHFGWSIGHRQSSKSLELRVGDGKQLLVHTFNHEPIKTGEACNRTIIVDGLPASRRFSLWVDGVFAGSVDFESKRQIYDESTASGCWLGDVWGWKFMGDVHDFRFESIGTPTMPHTLTHELDSPPLEAGLDSGIVEPRNLASDENAEARLHVVDRPAKGSGTATPAEKKAKAGTSSDPELESDGHAVAPKQATKPSAANDPVEPSPARPQDSSEQLTDRAETLPLTQSSSSATSLNRGLTKSSVSYSASEMEPTGSNGNIDQPAVSTIMGYINRATNEKGEWESWEAVPDHDRLKDSLVSDKDWKRDDISTWIKRWGTLTAEAQKADAATLAAAAAAAAAAKDIAAAEAAANATNETQKFVILQNVAFRKSMELDDKHKTGGVRQGTVVAGMLHREGDLSGTHNASLSIVNGTNDDVLWLEVLNPEGIASSRKARAGTGSGKKNKRRKKQKQELTEKQKRKLEEKKAAAEAAAAEAASMRFFVPVRVDGLLTAVEHGTPERHFVAQEGVAFRSKPEWEAKTPGGVRDGDLVRMLAGCEHIDSDGVTWVQVLEGSWLPLKNKKGETLLLERSVNVLKKQEEEAAAKAEKAAEKKARVEEEEAAAEAKGGSGLSQSRTQTDSEKRGRRTSRDLLREAGHRSHP